ncbi:uncharacterized protein [Argopecten irradians]|uniref:uncharacterized protein n=1 Tax=Argopecten irradians TaxID=31199 RepID=UPI003721F13B
MYVKTAVITLSAFYIFGLTVGSNSDGNLHQSYLHGIGKSIDRYNFRNSSAKLESETNLFRGKRSRPTNHEWYLYSEVSWVSLVKRKSTVMDKLFPNLMSNTLRNVGLYLAAHKYFEVDRRYTFSTTKYEDRKFFKHFPIPRLKNLHPVVEEACNKGVIECMTEIESVAKISGTFIKSKVKKGIIPPEYPFSSALEQFQYRTTASYYMCWYTELRSKPLAYEGHTECLASLELSSEANGEKIYDWRSIGTAATARRKRNKRVSPFTCAYLWFCPDPCYGKNSLGKIRNLKQALADPLNPCRKLKDRACFWMTSKNNNFEDLQRNRINYTCNCRNERPGFIWSPKYSICIDQDECYDGVANCSSDKVCRNGVGTYKCHCRRGFKQNTTTGLCERHALFRPTSHMSMKPRKEQQEEDQSRIWTAIDRLFGLNSSTRNYHSTIFQIVCFTLCSRLLLELMSY